MERSNYRIETERLTGQPAATIVDYADTNEIDRIVVGSHGRSGISRILLGSVRKSAGFSSQSDRGVI